MAIYMEIGMELILEFEAWIVLAIIFSGAEILIPGGILLNLGIASILIAIGIQQQLLNTLPHILIIWLIIASILLFILYVITDRFFSDKQVMDPAYEALDIFGKEVEVSKTIGPAIKKGRVKFQGRSWVALGDGSKIEKGSYVTVICKDNISLIVEPKKIP